MTIHTALLQGSRLLEEGAVAASRLTAEVLLGFAVGKDRPYLYGHPEVELREVEWLHFGRYLHERLKGKPTQYITKIQEFYGRPFHVTPAVLIPRPETEHVIDAASPMVRNAARILDVGCGSGAIAVTLQLETGAQVFATDISLPALAIAAQNAARLGAHVHPIACDLVSAIADHSVDLLVSNPPYISSADMAGLQPEVRDHEPHVALFSGPTGFEIYERLIAGAPRVLRAGGCMVLELGYNSRDRVLQLLDRRWRDVQVFADLAGIPRVVSCRLAAT